MRRVLSALGVLITVSVVVFAATEAAPGDAASARLGPQAAPEAVEALRRELGLDRPAVLRYLDWLGGLWQGDLGVSMTNGRPVAEVLAERAANSAVLGLIGASLLVALAALLGVGCGLRAGGRADRIVSGVLLTLAGIPEFVTGTLLTLLFAVQLGVLPAVSLGPSPAALVLPLATLLAVCLAQNVRLLRAVVADTAATDAVESARLNGVPEHRVVLRYILPVAVVPALPVLARYVAYLLGGTLVAETLFGYPGLASVLVQATAARDVAVVQAVALLAAALTVALNLAADLLAAALDPRERRTA